MTENMGTECIIVQKGMKTRGFSADLQLLVLTEKDRNMLGFDRVPVLHMSASASSSFYFIF